MDFQYLTYLCQSIYILIKTFDIYNINEIFYYINNVNIVKKYNKNKYKII